MAVQDISIKRSATLREALAILNSTGSGILLLLRDDLSFERTVTDGDLRRLLLDGHALEDELVSLPVLRSVVVTAACGRREALELMNSHGINHLPVLDENRNVIRVLDRRQIGEHILLSTPHIGSAEKEFVEEAFRTNWIAPLGPNVDAFERELAALVGVRHAAAVNSGTAALHLALRLLGIEPGDRVFCSTLTFAASVNPIIYQGAEPVFIDSDEISWNMSPEALERAFSHAVEHDQLPKAVIIVNLYGQSADMDTLTAICDRYDIPVVEDAAESLGARYKGQPSGTFGRLGVYSFNGNKIITTSGGGMLVSDDASLIERARFLSTQAREPAPHYEHAEVGYNYRMSNILAGVGRGQLKVLEERVAARRAVFARYREALVEVEALQWMPEPEWSYSTHWLTACVIDEQVTSITSRGLIESLAAEMIEARPIWKPMHQQPVFARYPYFNDGKSSVSDRLFRLGLCLPSGSNLSEASFERVVDVLKDVFARA